LPPAANVSINKEAAMAFFTKKKNKDEEEESLVSRAPRYDSLALVRVNGFEGQALLKNVSVTGFCMQSKTYANFTPGNKYTMQIFPEKSTGLRTIETEVEVRWIRSEVSKFEVGFLITQLAAGREMEKYVDYLKDHPEMGKAAGI
jgi:hypothetical protein